MQRRCVVCQRYLSKRQKKYCGRCAEKMYKENENRYEDTYRKKHNEQQKRWWRKNINIARLYMRLYMKVRSYADEYNVGDYI